MSTTEEVKRANTNRRLGRRGLRLSVIAIALFALVGGIAYAAIPNSGGVYTACMLKHVGTLRLIDTSLPSSNPMSHCSATFETQVTWNQTGEQGQQGPQGQQGQQGPQGPEGPAGASGLGHGYYATNTYTVDTDASHRVVGLSDLPAGSYAVFATVMNDGGDGAFCLLDKNGSSISDAVNFPLIDVSHAMTLTGVITTGGADVVEVVCQSQEGAITPNDSSEIAGSITAIKLDALN